MITLLIILMTIGAIVMAGYSYVQINQGKRTWLAVAVLGTTLALAMICFAVEFVENRYIGLTISMIALTIFGTIPGVVLGWLCADGNARKIALRAIVQIPFVGAALAALLKIIFNRLVDAFLRELAEPLPEEDGNEKYRYGNKPYRYDDFYDNEPQY